MTLQEKFVYDSLGRLVSVNFPGTEISTTNPQAANYQYNLDNMGNRTSTVASGGILLPTTPQVAALPKLLQGDFNNAAMMVLLSSGKLIGWGNNTTGALANGTTGATTSPMQNPVFNPNTTLPPSAATIVDWAFTNANLYVLYSNGWVYSAGANDYGQLSMGDTVQRPYLQRIDYFVTQGISVNQIWAAGAQATVNGGGCVYFGTSAGLYACGANLAGNLANASTPTANVLTAAPCVGIPTNVPITNVVISSVAGMFSTYVLCANGNLFVAGYNVYGQLGTNTTTNVTGSFVMPYQAPWPGPTFGSVKSVSASAGATAGGSGAGASALIIDGNGYLWGTGTNIFGQVFPATTAQINQFNSLNLGTGLSCGISGGGYSFTLQPNGGMNAWGYNTNNNLFLNSITSPAFGNAPYLPDAVASVYFPRSDNLASRQLIVLTASGRLVYAGSPNGIIGVNNNTFPGAYYYLPMPASIFNGTESIASVFVHGTNITQRLFLLTDQGNLYASGDNTNCICTGGLTSNNTPASINWHHIDFTGFIS